MRPTQKEMTEAIATSGSAQTPEEADAWQDLVRRCRTAMGANPDLVANGEERVEFAFALMGSGKRRVAGVKALQRKFQVARSTAYDDWKNMLEMASKGMGRRDVLAARAGAQYEMGVNLAVANQSSGALVSATNAQVNFFRLGTSPADVLDDPKERKKWIRAFFQTLSALSEEEVHELVAAGQNELRKRTALAIPSSILGDIAGALERREHAPGKDLGCPVCAERNEGDRST